MVRFDINTEVFSVGFTLGDMQIAM